MNDNSIFGNVVLDGEKRKATPKWYYDVKDKRLYIVHKGKYVLISRAVLDESSGDFRFAYLENSRRILLWNKDEMNDIPVY